jgi:hypothetical protein
MISYIIKRIAKTMKASTKKDIQTFFNSLPKKLFLRKDLYQILNQNYLSWKIQKSVNKFINLLKEMQLKEITLTSSYNDKNLTRFVWGRDISIYQLSLSLRPNSYFNHHTAAYLLGLTNKVSDTIYVNSEQSPKPENQVLLEQKDIDAAFKRQQRTSKYIFRYNSCYIYCLNGINTGNLGVITIEIPREGKLFVTNIERTLIDMAVRPIYSGGYKEVLNAYKNAKEKISINYLIDMLNKINYIYPYHQAIGFYLHRAGVEYSLLSKLKKFGLRYDFYLDYAMEKPKYSKEWRLHYPFDL